MAINKNHEFEELGGVKCSVVERNATKDRVTFLKELLEHNGFEVMVVTSPPPKAAQAVKSVPADQGEAQPQPQPQPTPPAENFTIGVTNLAFNPTNAIFGRLLKTKDGHIVTLTYWHQKETESHDEIPYYEQKL